MRTYNDITASCGVSAGVTLVKMNGYLVSLSYVNVTDDTCTGRKTSRSTMFIIFLLSSQLVDICPVFIQVTKYTPRLPW